MSYSQKEYKQMKEQIRISSNWDEEYIDRVVEVSLEKGYPICGAKARSTGSPCKNRQSKNGRCRVPQHQGGSGPTNPNKLKKNKNAVKTGEHETIWLDQLDEEEVKLFDLIPVDVMKQLDEEIKLTTLRERRMLKRIANLAQADFTEVERKYREGVGPEGKVDIKEGKELAALGQIQDIEEALTRVQSRKARLISIKHKIIDGDDPGKEKEVANFLSKLRKSVQDGS
ncbi:hypothetical protein [Natroniella sp. ANB-PHB2]|uniref:hypothetical protein n=1 Tax=Natroniella sp. ANB-PHB2 TaxID=3384444 RepID=UPI0038D455E7